MMVKLGTFLGFLVLSAAFPPGTVEAAAPCAKADALPQVSLETRPGRVAYNTSKNRRQLGHLQDRGKTSSSRRGWEPIGLTLTELQFSMNISVSTLARKRGGHCATVSSVKASLGYDTITIYVDSRFRPGSCQYRSVLEHENDHLAIFRDALAVYAPRVERRIAEAARSLEPIIATTPQKAADRLQVALQRKVEPLFKELNKVLDRKNDSIDTSANYKREQARCSSW
ncbi:MAG: hypothetical protein O3B76_03485 [Proteobacteria bacterium]|nr:hypothetical protein [Pseudomonadota bacterium]MDA1022676.1 hypothetical protein [Pseudomonadota bacterium]